MQVQPPETAAFIAHQDAEYFSISGYSTELKLKLIF
jgi:hypothetical protein